MPATESVAAWWHSSMIIVLISLHQNESFLDRDDIVPITTLAFGSKSFSNFFISECKATPVHSILFSGARYDSYSLNRSRVWLHSSLRGSITIHLFIPLFWNVYLHAMYDTRVFPDEVAMSRHARLLFNARYAPCIW